MRTAKSRNLATMALVSAIRSEEHTSELQSPCNLVSRLLLEKKRHNLLANCLTCPMREDHLFANLPPFALQRLNDIFFFFNDTATTEIYTLSLHDALPI